MRDFQEHLKLEIRLFAFRLDYHHPRNFNVCILKLKLVELGLLLGHHISTLQNIHFKIQISTVFLFKLYPTLQNGKKTETEILTGYSRRRIKWGTAPASTTTLVCKELPEAMLVKAQAASKSIVLVSCWSGEDTLKKATNFGTVNIQKSIMAWVS